MFNVVWLSGYGFTYKRVPSIGVCKVNFCIKLNISLFLDLFILLQVSLFFTIQQQDFFLVA